MVKFPFLCYNILKTSLCNIWRGGGMFGIYYVQIRAYSSVKEKKIYGKYSSPKRINIK